MQSSTGYSCALLITLAACATPAPPPAPVPEPHAAVKISEQGTVLAVRPVPQGNQQTARILLTSLGGAVASTDATNVEYIVRAQDGATISVVQADTTGLRPGDRVSIRRGVHTRISSRLATPDSD